MALKIGDQVRHPSRGQGRVVTLVYSPLRPDTAIKAWVEFAFCAGSGSATRKFCCFADDLVVVTGAAPGKPALAVDAVSYTIGHDAWACVMPMRAGYDWPPVPKWLAGMVQ